MFGASKKSRRDLSEEERRAEWERSPSVPVDRPTGLKTKILLAHLDREIRVLYRNEPCVIRPLALFRKPAYGRMYVEAECEAVIKVFNIADISVPRPDSDTFYGDDDEPAEGSGSRSLWGWLIVLVALGIAAAVFSGALPQAFDALKDKLPLAPQPPAGQQGDNVDSNPPGDPAPAPAPPSADPATTPFENPASSPPPATGEIAPPTTPAEDANFGREFADASGKFRTRAEFVEFQPDRGRGSRVILRKADGSEVDVPMNSLSKEDQAWIREEVRRRKS